VTLHISINLSLALSRYPNRAALGPVDLQVSQCLIQTSQKHAIIISNTFAFLSESNASLQKVRVVSGLAHRCFPGILHDLAPKECHIWSRT
jgi:hypothetical protein